MLCKFAPIARAAVFAPIVLAFAVSLTGCGLKKKSSDAAAPSNDTGFFADQGLIGTWENACTDTDKGGSFQSRYVFSGAGLKDIFTRYMETGCRQGNESIAYTEEFSNAREVAPSDLPADAAWKTVRFELITNTATPLCACTATDLNAVKNFDYDDWSLGAVKDVSGRKYNAAATAENTTGGSFRRTMKTDGTTLTRAKYSGNAALVDDKPAASFTRVP